MYEQNCIIRDLRVLQEQFIPARIIHRDGQLRAISDNLKPLIKDMPARNSFIWGAPGTGKTCMSRYAAEELKKYAPASVSYINCWEAGSRFRILYNILKDLGQLLAISRKGIPTDELLDTLTGRLRNRRLVVILDEVDQLEDEKILYDLVSLERLSLILISNSETVFFDIDPRIRSRLLTAENIEFQPYRDYEIADILADRAEWGLVPGTVSRAQLERIAELCNGDARAAIGALRIAAEQAENRDIKKIPDAFIENAVMKTELAGKEETASRLTGYQKALFEIIRDKDKIEAGELHKAFEAACRKNELGDINERTLRKHLEKLSRSGLIEAEGEGRWRVYSARSPQQP